MKKKRGYGYQSKEHERRRSDYVDLSNSQTGIVVKTDPATKEIRTEVVTETPLTKAKIMLGGVKVGGARIGIVPEDELNGDIDFVQNMTPNGVILSPSDILVHPYLLVYASREVLSRVAAEEVLEPIFSEIKFPEDERYDSVPTIATEYGTEGVEMRNGKWLGKESPQVAKLGESIIYEIMANHHLVAICKAYNYLDDDPSSGAGIENTEGIQYEWRFDSGEENYDVHVIQKVVSTNKVLSIENAQRAHIGRYTCHVTNKHGTSKTMSFYVNVFRPGEIREQKITLPDGSEILTGQYEWIPNDNTSGHDENYNIHDDKWLYSDDEINQQLKWKKVYWDEQGSNTAGYDIWRIETTNDKFRDRGYADGGDYNMEPRDIRNWEDIE